MNLVLGSSVGPSKHSLAVLNLIKTKTVSKQRGNLIKCDCQQYRVCWFTFANKQTNKHTHVADCNMTSTQCGVVGQLVYGLHEQQAGRSLLHVVYIPTLSNTNDGTFYNYLSFRFVLPVEILFTYRYQQSENVIYMC